MKNQEKIYVITENDYEYNEILFFVKESNLSLGQKKVEELNKKELERKQKYFQSSPDYGEEHEKEWEADYPKFRKDLLDWMKRMGVSISHFDASPWTLKTDEEVIRQHSDRKKYRVSTTYNIKEVKELKEIKEVEELGE